MDEEYLNTELQVWADVRCKAGLAEIEAAALNILKGVPPDPRGNNTHDGHMLDPERGTLCLCEVCIAARQSEVDEINRSGCEPFTPEDVQEIRYAWARLALSDQYVNTVKTSVGLYWVEIHRETQPFVWGGDKNIITYMEDLPSN